jgi:cytochrome b pre-mRNA-processing protein 3
MFLMLNALRRASARARAVRSLYDALIFQARRPVFFAELGVKDSLDGRFDMVTLHAWLVLDRLRTAHLPDLAQALSDMIFIGFDEALRDLGAGDMGMGSKIKTMREAFNGRLKAYDSADGEAELAAAIRRNLFRGNEDRDAQAQIIARYALSTRALLVGCDPASGELDFAPLPEGLGKK